MKLLIAENLSATVNGKTILKPCSFEVNGGDFLCILGKNGSGKTTLAKLLAGINDISAGKITFYTNKICYIPQDTSNFFVSGYLTDDLLFSLNNKSLTKAQKKNKLQQALKKTGLENCEHRTIKSLSGGEKERAALAVCLIKEPEILLLDDSFCFLDKPAQEELLTLLKSLVFGKKNFAIIFITSNASVISYASKTINL